MQKTLLIKFVMVAVLALLALIPLALVQALIAERFQSMHTAIDSIAASSARAQLIEGPLIVVPYKRRWIETTAETKDDKEVVRKRERVEEGRVTIFPEHLGINATASTEERYKSLYKALLISNELDFTARFVIPQGYRAIKGEGTLEWGRARLLIGVGDPRGIRNQPTLQWGGKPVEFIPATHGRGIEADLGELGDSAAQWIDASLKLSLLGMENIRFAPTGKESVLRMKSAWPHPGFIGSALPTTREISPEGFSAEWRTSFFSTNLKAYYLACLPGVECRQATASVPDAVGVSFVQPVNLHQQLERSAKYGILFVGLTFLAFLLFEIFKRLAVHPVQYSLVAVALAMFYLLLTSLAEHIAFVWAYTSAASACVLLIGVYVGYVLKSIWRGLTFTAMLAGLYGTLFVILRAEDHALLMGSVMLFAMLSAVMLGTRKVDWYSLAREETPPVVASTP